MTSPASLTPTARRASAFAPLGFLTVVAGALILLVWRLTTPPDVVELPPPLTAGMVQCEIGDGVGGATRVFWADRFEVTQSEFAVFVTSRGGAMPRHWGGRLPSKKAGPLPVTHVTWFDADAYSTFVGKRLPTLAEWTATVGSSGIEWPWGDLFSTACANTFELGVGGPVRVGMFESGKSSNGAYDLSGNVAEWTSTRVPSDLDDRVVVCGGSFLEDAGASRVNPSVLGMRTEGRRSEGSDLGFRCVLDSETQALDQALRADFAALGFKDPFGRVAEVAPAMGRIKKSGDRGLRLALAATPLNNSPVVLGRLREIVQRGK